VEQNVRLGWRDAWLPALLLALGTVELALLGTRGWTWSVALEAVGALLLVFRRQYAIVVAPLMAVTMMIIPLTGTQMNEAATPILFYILGIFSLGRRIAGPRGLVALGVIVGMIFADFAFVDPRDHDWTDVVFVLSLGVPPYLFGWMVRRLDEQSRMLAAQQKVVARQAVSEERTRIARELHDVVAHSISAMVVQTAAAQDLVHSDPARASAMLTSVAATGREALAETGRLLHLIRDETDELGLRPAPGLGEVPALVESFRASGLEVQADLDLPAASLPGGVDVSAYRVVQELLTNALKYADGAVRLSVTSTAGRLRIWCANPVGPVGAGAGSGLGLQGITERVSLLGGTVDRGRRADGRFVVEVDIPLAREPAS
jgi:signal transduction histidine kinase